MRLAILHIMTFDFSVDLLNITFSTKFSLKTKKNIKKRKNVSFLDQKSYITMIDNSIQNITPNITPNITTNITTNITYKNNDNIQLEERSFKRPRSNAIIS